MYKITDTAARCREMDEPPTFICSSEFWFSSSRLYQCRFAVTLVDVITRGGNKGNMYPKERGKRWGTVGIAPVILNPSNRA
jgi:hypothetical protein